MDQVSNDPPNDEFDDQDNEENDILRSPDATDEDLERQACVLRREIEGLERVDATLTAVQLRSGTLTKAEEDRIKRGEAFSSQLIAKFRPLADAGALQFAKDYPFYWSAKARIEETFGQGMKLEVCEIMAMMATLQYYGD